MAQSIRTVNPQVEDGKIVSGDPNSEQIDQWRVRANLEVIDDLSKDAASITKPADANLSQREVASEVVVTEDGTEKTIYELPKDQIEAYNTMLDNAAKKQSEISQRTAGQIPDESSAIKENKIDDSINLVRLNSPLKSKSIRAELAGQTVNVVTGKDLEMTPQELIQSPE